MKFSNAVIKQFHKVVECPVTVIERARLLESMEEMFTIPEFSIYSPPSSPLVYEDDSKRILGMKYLLGTWEVLLDGLNDVGYENYLFRSRFARVIDISFSESLRRLSFVVNSCLYDPNFVNYHFL